MSSNRGTVRDGTMRQKVRRKQWVRCAGEHSHGCKRSVRNPIPNVTAHVVTHSEYCDDCLEAVKRDMELVRRARKMKDWGKRKCG
jgi:hypothetical protein